MVKQKIDFAIPTPDQMALLRGRTMEILEELHHSLSGSMMAPRETTTIEDFRDIDFNRGEALREPMFYAAESAYCSQYRDLAPLKYKADDQWMQSERGFTIDQAAKIGKAIMELERTRLEDRYNALIAEVPDSFTLLPGFTFTSGELLERVDEEESTIANVLNAFSILDGERNDRFQALNDFNLVNAKPIILRQSGTYILFQAYSFYEALYESPFYWMLKDDLYRDTALKHRGDFTEEFSAKCLARVFGEKCTHSNVIIEENAATTAGEIDNLILFGNRAIVVQVKSKRLTLEARKGNDGAIQKDFSASIVDSYHQALECATRLLRRDRRFVDKNGKPIKLPHLKKVYLLCLVSDHYPSLSFQVGRFLAPVISKEIPAPFVADVFTLDVMTEMLDSPLHLLSYVDRRTSYGDRIFAGHELTNLACHLISNLWLSDSTDVMYVTDEICGSLDAAMAVRRDGVPGERTPPGILTLMKGSAYDRLVSQLDNDPRDDLVDLGMMLLKMSSKSASQLSQGLDYVRERARATRGYSNVTMGSGKDSGITVHCRYRPNFESPRLLEEHVLVKKYQQKASSWFGIGIHPEDGSLLYGYNAEFEWTENAGLEEASRSLSTGLGMEFVDGKPRKRKVGRNDPCPCGSGKKFKKCHLNS